MFKIQSLAKQTGAQQTGAQQKHTQQLARPQWFRSAQVVGLCSLALMTMQGGAIAAPNASTSAAANREAKTTSSPTASPRTAITSAVQAMMQETALQLALVNAAALPRSTGPRLQDGIHFYGEAPERDQINHAYMVFEVKGAKVAGALYWPNSSYSCFEGRFNNKQLALRIDDPFSDATYLQEVALTETAIVASSDLQSVEMEIGLADMYALNSANSKDHEFLADCRAAL